MLLKTNRSNLCIAQNITGTKAITVDISLVKKGGGDGKDGSEKLRFIENDKRANTTYTTS